jgi:hypothetical protein
MSKFDFNLFKNRMIQDNYATVRTPNEIQYDKAGAFSLIAYKNQDPTQASDLDTAKSNFEKRYQQFLMMFGQYSNTPLKHYPLTTPATYLQYPITNTTAVFDQYPMKKPNFK